MATSVFPKVIWKCDIAMERIIQYSSLNIFIHFVDIVMGNTVNSIILSIIGIGFCIKFANFLADIIIPFIGI